MAQVQSPDRDFTSIPLDGDAINASKKKAPRRILHFSDGIVEEYSTDEEVEVVSKTTSDPYDQRVRTLNWLPWIWYYLALVSSKTFNAADLCGEKLAWFFGITTPKYQYAIDEFYRNKELDEKGVNDGEPLQTVKSNESVTVTAPPVSIVPSSKGPEPSPHGDYQSLDKF